LRQLRERGWTAPDVDIEGAAVMLTGTVISDVMGRPIVGDVYPPRDEVAERYCTLFLRSLGFPGKLGAPEGTPKYDAPSQPIHGTHT
jgi:hypothetical protein